MGTTPTTPTYPLPISGIMLAGIQLVTSSQTFDPTQAAKRWVDLSKAGLPPNGMANYLVFDSENATEVPLTITNAVAATANIPAYYPPAPAIAPTPATETLAGNTSITIPVNPQTHSTQAQALALAAEVGAALGLTLTVTVPPTSFAPNANGQPTVGYIFNPNGETRQQWAIVAGSISANVGQLLAQQNANGIGAPGSWAFNSSSQIVWNATPVPQPTASTPPDMPFPVRALLPNENFFSPDPLAPTIWEVTSSTSPAALAGPMTVAQGNLIQTDLNLIKQFLGING